MAFIDDDVANLKKFLQFIADKATFSELDWSDAILLAHYRVFMVKHLKQVNDHVLELKSIKVPEDDSNRS